MYVLKIEHPVPNFEGWKQAFESDPVGREKSGVRRYRILRDVEDRNFVTIELEFDTREEAQGLLDAMRGVWSRVEGSVMTNPVSRISEAVDVREY